MDKQQYIDFAFVKEHADFEKVLGYYNLKVSGRSKQLTVLCPFHDDTKPSLKVTPEKKSFHCFGCGAKGGLLDFVRYMEECAETVANICRIDLAPPRPLSNACAHDAKVRRDGRLPRHALDASADDDHEITSVSD